MLKACALVAVAACASQPPPHDIREQSGTRLKIERWAWGDSVYRGIYDAELGIECQFQRQPDGGYYCLPAGGPTAPLSAYVRGARDVQRAAASVVPVSFCTDDGLVVPAGFHDTARDVACTPTRILAGDFECVPQTGATAGDPAMRFEYMDNGTELSIGFFVTDDGLRQHTSDLFDLRLLEECRFGTAGGPNTCLPGLVRASATVDP